MMRSKLRLGAVMDAASWLRSLGLEKYEPVFRENERTTQSGQCAQGWS
jgi:hypothetical protein